MNEEQRNTLMQKFFEIFTHHKEESDIVRILQTISEDQGFFEAPFSRARNDKFTYDGSLSVACMEGYKALRFLEKIAIEIYGGDPFTNRAVLCFLIAMTGRWKDLSTGDYVYRVEGFGTTKCSAITNGVVNANILGIKLASSEVLAVSKHNRSLFELFGEYEGFCREWWVLNQIMAYLHVANRGLTP